MHLEFNVQIVWLNYLKHFRMHLDHRIELTIMNMLKICITTMVFLFDGTKYIHGEYQTVRTTVPANYLVAFDAEYNQ